MIQCEPEPIPTRHSLLGRLKDWQDHESWREFFQTYWRLVYSVALKSGLTETEAHDVVQETFVSLAKTMPKYKYDPGVCSFKTWLQHLARKRIVDQIRKRPPVSVASRGSDDASRTATIERVADRSALDVDAMWDRQWHETLLDRAMEAVKGKVKPKQYQIFHLYVIKQLSVQDVARSLRVNVGQVYLAKHRVGGLIKKELRLLEARLI